MYKYALPWRLVSSKPAVVGRRSLTEQYYLRALLLPLPCSSPLLSHSLSTMPKRKSSSVAADVPYTNGDMAPPPLKRRASQRKSSTGAKSSTNPDKNANVLDGPEALRASPDAEGSQERMDVDAAGMDSKQQIREDVAVSAPSDVPGGKAKEEKKGKGKGGTQKQSQNVKVETVQETTPLKPSQDVPPAKTPQFLDPEAEGEEEANEEELKEALSRPPPVNSDYLPLPWKGRLGYVSTVSLTL